MKLIFLPLLLSTLLYSSMLTGSTLNDYNTALQKANQEHKLLLVIVGTQGCKWCGKLIHFTVESSSIQAIIDKEYLVLYSHKIASPIAKHFETTLFPSSYIVAPNGSVLSTIAGYKLVDEYKIFLEEGITKHVQKP